MFGAKRFKAVAAEVKRARQAELEQLITLPPAAELAAKLMPAFGPNGPSRGKPLSTGDIVDWMLRDYRLTFRERALCMTKMSGPVSEALQVLARAELVNVMRQGGAPDAWQATRVGLAALANGDYRQRITARTGELPAAARGTSPRPSSAERLQELESLRAANVISETEYAAKRAQIIKEI